MSNNKSQASIKPDCVTEVRMGNTILTVSGFFKKNATATAEDKMLRVLEAEAICKNQDTAEKKQSA